MPPHLVMHAPHALAAFPGMSQGLLLRQLRRGCSQLFSVEVCRSLGHTCVYFLHVWASLEEVSIHHTEIHPVEIQYPRTLRIIRHGHAACIFMHSSPAAASSLIPKLLPTVLTFACIGVLAP